MAIGNNVLPYAPLTTACLCLTLMPAGCERAAPRIEPAQTQPTESTSSPLRPVHVLVCSDAGRFRIRSGSSILFTGSGDATPVTLAPDTWHDGSLLENGVHVLIHGAPRMLPARFEATHGAPLQLDCVGSGATAPARWYPGAMVLQAGAPNTLEIVNEVGVERYVASVVAGELPTGFDRETLRVGAIVARTFVLDQMHRRNRAGYDVGTGQGSQVYLGVVATPAGRAARRAAADTYGLVCTWHDAAGDHLFPAYYSSVCGGVSQSAGMFGQSDDVPPLRGGVRCDFCKIAPQRAYRWGPVEIALSEVYARLLPKVARIASLGGIVGVRVAKRTRHGRPLKIQLDGVSGASVELLAERFRLALGSAIVKSTQFDLSVDDGTLVFRNGRGFGHGLGLCQWGAEGQARAGKSAGEILRYYYPGTRVTRVY
ncbi:MAG: SpoIID/LytB domain-containing protein [Phycisphaerae bacterium]